MCIYLHITILRRLFITMDESDSDDSDADHQNICIDGSIPTFFISNCRHAFLCAFLRKLSYDILQPISFNTIFLCLPRMIFLC